MYVEKALSTDPDNWNYLYAKGLGYYKQDRIKDAYQIINRAWDLRPLYYHEHNLLLQELKKELSQQNSGQ